MRSRLQFDPLNERGAVVIHVAFALLALTMLSAFVVDYGELLVSRGQAQNAADAGALAGAVALAYNSYTDRSVTGPAVQGAINTGKANLVNRGAVSILPMDRPTGDRMVADDRFKQIIQAVINRRRGDRDKRFVAAAERLVQPAKQFVGKTCGKWRPAAGWWP